mmetsp:Transcript_27104/g.69816  ORF Transcript_27104/g.69816 Transcript_27104/m.69816 type:complete len:211 (+) Transcript_27104:675-1307(+)
MAEFSFLLALRHDGELDVLELAQPTPEVEQDADLGSIDHMFLAEQVEHISSRLLMAKESLNLARGHGHQSEEDEKFVAISSASRRMEELSHYFSLITTGELTTSANYDTSDILRLLYRFQDLVQSVLFDDPNWKDHCEDEELGIKKPEIYCAEDAMDDGLWGVDDEEDGAYDYEPDKVNIKYKRRSGVGRGGGGAQQPARGSGKKGKLRF